MKRRGILLLDRDGVLNSMVVDPEHGTIDSPLHPDQVRLLSGVKEAISTLVEHGYEVAVVTNQPAARKGKTTQANLEAVHRKVLREAGVTGHSEICFHTAQDRCACRKPLPGMLLSALKTLNYRPGETVWMVGDGVTDMQAAKAAGTRAAFLGPRKMDAEKVFHDLDLSLDFWGERLLDFAHHILRERES